MIPSPRLRPGLWVALGLLCARAAAPPVILPDTRGDLVLRAQDARLAGATFKLETKWGAPNIGYWSNANDALEWLVAAEKTGTYQVELDYACENASAGGTFEIRVGEKVVTFKPAGTGGWGNFVTAKLGGVLLPEAGPMVVKAKPAHIRPPGILNLRQVRLVAPR